MMKQSKVCTKCKQEKSITEFHRDGQYRISTCKQCFKIWRKNYYSDPQKREAKNKAHREYSKQPDVIKRRKLYMKKKNYENSKQPHVIQSRKVYRQRTYVIENHRVTNSKHYHLLPEDEKIRRGVVNHKKWLRDFPDLLQLIVTHIKIKNKIKSLTKTQ